MRNTTCVLMALLLLSTACSQRTEVAKRGEPEGVDSAQELDVALPESDEAVDSGGETGNNSEVTEASDLESKVNDAKLSSEAATELVNLDNNNQREIPVKVVVPTYIPDGFEVTEVVSEDGRFGPSYSIKYLNTTTNGCFEISAASGGFGGPTEDFEQVIEIDSKALGEINLGYTESHSISNQPLIAFANSTVPGIVSAPQEYSFWSPTPSNKDCSVLDLKEAEKTVKSLDYLNP